MKLTVVVPVYGVEKYIARNVRSLFEQTLDSVEYIFVDDCSPDKSMEVLAEIIDDYRTRLEEKGSVVRTVRMPANSGLAAVRRHGIQLSTGEYIIHCDSDDWIAECHAYEKMYTKAKEDNLDVVICEYYEGDEHNKVHNRIKTQLENKMLIEEMLCHLVPVSIWNKMIRAELFCNKKILYPSNNMGEDFVMTIQIAYYAKRVGYIHEPLYFYYRNMESITKMHTPSSVYHRYQDMKANIGLVLEFLRREGIDEQYKDELKVLKEDCRYLLLPLVDDEQYRKEWLTAFDELSYSISDWFNPTWRKYALRRFLVVTKLYVYFRAIKHLLLN